MKKLLFFITATLIFISCSKENEIQIQPGNKLVTINLPSSITGKTYTKDMEVGEPVGDPTLNEPTITFAQLNVYRGGQTTSGIIKITLDNSENIKELEISENILIATDLDSDFLFSYLETNPESEPEIFQASCIASCQTAFTGKDGKKIKGRGACKANC